MSAPACLRCGAPWKGNLSGACTYCGQLGAPPGSELPPGFGLDPEAFCMALLARASGPAPLDGLATPLRAALGPQAVVGEAGAGGTAVLWVRFHDFTFRFAPGTHGAPEVLAVHEVRGIVLKQEALDLTSGIAELAVQLATWAGRDPATRTALVHAFS